MKHGKKYINALAQVNREQLVTVNEAVAKVKSLATAKFDETVELAIRLGVDPRKAEQIVRGTISLPAGTGKTNVIAVFATGEAAQAARDAGADFVGKVGGLGRVLGPRGLMPNPKTGTVTMDVAKAVGEFKGGRVEYRTDKIGNVQLRVGKVSFSTEDLARNVHAVIDEVVRVKPASAKGRYLLSITVSSTMGPGVKIDPQHTRDLDEALVGA
jgi:large subunit ribosomal protein L1